MVEPKSLLVDADIKRDGINFLGADSEVRIPDITIGQNGSLKAVIYNYYGDKMVSGNYSLLWYAEALTIKNNHGAVQDLAAYVTW